MSTNVQVNVQTDSSATPPGLFPLAMPVTFYNGGNAATQLRAQWTNLLSTVEGQTLAVLYQDGSNSGLSPGLGVNGKPWQVAIPYQPFITDYVIDGGTATIYYNVTKAYPVPSGALVFREGVLSNVSTIPAGKGVWATLQVSQGSSYTLPPATDTTLGGVIVKDGLNVNSAGELKANVLSVNGKTGAVDLKVADISGAAPLASPAFTGNPTAVTQAATDNSTKLATTAQAQAMYSDRLNKVVPYTIHDYVGNATLPDETVDCRIIELKGSTGGAYTLSIPRNSGRWLVMNNAWNYGSGHYLKTTGQTSGTTLHIPQGAVYEVMAVDTGGNAATQSLMQVPSAYELPVATDKVLGGVKIGANLTISDGVLSGAAPYTLPVASANTLGGVKIGANLTISDGVLSATVPAQDNPDKVNDVSGWGGIGLMPDFYQNARSMRFTGTPSSNPFTVSFKDAGQNDLNDDKGPWLLFNDTQVPIRFYSGGSVGYLTLAPGKASLAYVIKNPDFNSSGVIQLAGQGQ
jgi:hypothetical protein